MGTAIILLIMAVLVFFAVRSSKKHLTGQGGCCGGGGGSLPEEKKKLEHSVIAKKTLTIEGMHCDNCKNAVMKHLQRIDGVSCSVNLRKKQAVVEMDREVSDEELTAAVTRAGYEVVSIA
ncbi:MAG: heavy metal-associated domain-containing protein [Eubacteriales bacterium]|nr:heavy metal-associated domain-containing protein [Eubacteriales bacterium]